MEIAHAQLPAASAQLSACATGDAEDAMDTYERRANVACSVAGTSGTGSRESNMAVDSDTLTDESEDEVPTSRSESECSYFMDTLSVSGGPGGPGGHGHHLTAYCDSNQQKINSGIYKNLRVRKTRRPVQEKVRHKRQTLRDMTKPLKQWLYRNRDNPYPNKADKMTLALNSQMTLTQVSNWFANARRRLKNTVVEPDLTWSKRIKRYNSHANGNQELLSISSGSDSESDDDKTEKELDLNTKGSVESSGLRAQALSDPLPGIHEVDVPESAHALAYCGNVAPAKLGPDNSFKTVASADAGSLLPSNGSLLPSNVEQPTKISQTILHRYLNDQQTVQLTMSRDGTRHRNPSGSLSSHDFEDLSSSSRSTPIREQLLADDCMDEYEEFSRHFPDRLHGAEDDLYWKEIGAALALTTLSRSRHNSGASSKSRFSMQ